MAIFTSGTKTIFQQSSAPTGWTKEVTNFNNHKLRVVNGTTSSGGTVDFTTVFSSSPYSFTNSTFSNPSVRTGLTAMPVENLPVHNHNVSAPAYAIGPTTVRFGGPTSMTGPVTTVGVTFFTTVTGTTGSNAGHDHPLSITVSGTIFNINVKYVDVIIATLD